MCIQMCVHACVAVVHMRMQVCMSPRVHYGKRYSVCSAWCQAAPLPWMRQTPHLMQMTVI